ncbi:unnamed protein product [Orchesella dallaii]|uniref:DOPA 4,5-dioxygenase n=1 Tax=Orchesella dallaii TaxID=48710 RepID=A0ABP1PRH4_9HEXA
MAKIFQAALVLMTATVLVWCKYYDESHVNGYHFHVYFFSGVQRNTQEALAFRDAIQQQIYKGNLRNCILKAVNTGPFGPHMVANYETCCNKSSIAEALSFFMINHGNLTVLFHPLTRYERLDHTGREMFLGPRIPIDTNVLSDDLQDYLDMCTTTEQVKVYPTSVATNGNPGGNSRKAAPKQPLS